MKKIYLSIYLLALTCVAAQAQLIPSIQFGIKGALNFSSIPSSKDLLSSDTRTGYQAGFYARFGAVGLHFQPELYLTGKSADAKFKDENGGEATAKVTFTSLDLPLLLGTRIGLGPIGFRIQAGPVVSFLTNKGIGDAFKNVMHTDQYKNQAWAITGGIGVDIGKLRADLRYEHGLSDLSKNDSYPQKLRLWNFGIGYRLF
ncbi:Outer membrane protein beta-barrel domain-containing protein [bacterium A37T11]|nr:Outer membrane protein beta-barrel domain-containing protein [bacterium A37T11]